MTAKTVARVASLALAIGAAGCMGFYEIPIETPIQAKLDVTAFTRVLVVGFLAGGSKAVDPNTETARLLRSQLRTKSELKIIDADVRSLVDEVDKRRGTPAWRCRRPRRAGRNRPTTRESRTRRTFSRTRRSSPTKSTGRRSARSTSSRSS